MAPSARPKKTKPPSAKLTWTNIPSFLTPDEHRAALASIRAGTPHPKFTRADLEIVARAFEGCPRTVVMQFGPADIRVNSWNRHGFMAWRGAFTRVSADVWGWAPEPRRSAAHRSATLSELAARAASGWALEPRDDAMRREDVTLPLFAAMSADGARREAGLVPVVGVIDAAGRAALDDLAAHEDETRATLLAGAHRALVARGDTRSADETARDLKLLFVYVHPLALDGVAYLGFELGSARDALGGVGATMHGRCVIRVDDRREAWWGSATGEDARQANDARAAGAGNAPLDDGPRRAIAAALAPIAGVRVEQTGPMRVVATSELPPRRRASFHRTAADAWTASIGPRTFHGTLDEVVRAVRRELPLEPLDDEPLRMGAWPFAPSDGEVGELPIRCDEDIVEGPGYEALTHLREHAAAIARDVIDAAVEVLDDPEVARDKLHVQAVTISSREHDGAAYLVLWLFEPETETEVTVVMHRSRVVSARRENGAFADLEVDAQRAEA